jgi:hypothetical protein
MQGLFDGMRTWALLLNFLEAVVELADLAPLLDVDELGAHPSDGRQEFVELDLPRERVFARRPLDEEQEHKRGHGEELFHAASELQAYARRCSLKACTVCLGRAYDG